MIGYFAVIEYLILKWLAVVVVGLPVVAEQLCC